MTPEAERLETEAWWSYQDLRAATRRPLGPWPTDAQLEDAYARWSRCHRDRVAGLPRGVGTSAPGRPIAHLLQQWAPGGTYRRSGAGRHPLAET